MSGRRNGLVAPNKQQNRDPCCLATLWARTAPGDSAEMSGHRKIRHTKLVVLSWDKHKKHHATGFGWPLGFAGLGYTAISTRARIERNGNNANTIRIETNGNKANTIRFFQTGDRVGIPTCPNGERYGHSQTSWRYIIVVGGHIPTRLVRNMEPDVQNKQTAALQLATLLLL
jgi:hypothetical protein